MSVTIHDAIVAINENATAVVEGTDINDCNIIWMDGTTEIPKADIEAKMTELQTGYDNQEYARNREPEYPSTDELIVALWENVVEERASAVVALDAIRQQVKARHPKP